MHRQEWERNMHVVIGYPALAAELPGASVRTLRRMVHNGQIPFRRLSGKLVAFDLDAVSRALIGEHGAESSRGR